MTPRIDLYGEAHGDKTTHDHLINNIIPEAKERGVKSYACEIPKSMQGSMDAFLNARDKGEKEPEKHFFDGFAKELNKEFERNNGIKGNINGETVMAADKKAPWSIKPGLDAAAKAHENGLKVYCVDADLHKHEASGRQLDNLLGAKERGIINKDQYDTKYAETLKERNDIMSKNIKEISKQGDVIGTFGAAHLEGQHSLGTKLRESGLDVKTHMEIPTHAKKETIEQLEGKVQYDQKIKNEHPNDKNYQVPSVDKISSTSDKTLKDYLTASNSEKVDKNAIYHGIAKGLEGDKENNHLAIEASNKWIEQNKDLPSYKPNGNNVPERNLAMDVRDGIVSPTDHSKNLFEKYHNQPLPGTTKMDQKEIALRDQWKGFEASNFQSGKPANSLEKMEVAENNGGAPQSKPKDHDLWGPSKIEAGARSGDKDLFHNGIKEALPSGLAFESINNSDPSKKMLGDIKGSNEQKYQETLSKLTPEREMQEKFASSTSEKVNTSLSSPSKSNNSPDLPSHLKNPELAGMIAGNTSYKTSMQEGLSSKDAGTIATSSSKIAEETSKKMPEKDAIDIGKDIAEKSKNLIASNKGASTENNSMSVGSITDALSKKGNEMLPTEKSPTSSKDQMSLG